MALPKLRHEPLNYAIGGPKNPLVDDFDFKADLIENSEHSELRDVLFHPVDLLEPSVENSQQLSSDKEFLSNSDDDFSIEVTLPFKQTRPRRYRELLDALGGYRD